MFVRNNILPPRKFARIAAARLFVALVCLLWMVSVSVAEAEVKINWFEDPISGNEITINENGYKITSNTSQTLKKMIVA